MSSPRQSVLSKIAIIFYWIIIHQLIIQFSVSFLPFEGLDGDLPYLNIWYTLFYLLKREYATDLLLGICFIAGITDFVLSIKYQQRHFRLWLIIHAIILLFSALPLLSIQAAYLHINLTLKP